MSSLLCVSGLNAFYGSSHVLHDVSIAMEPGEAVLLLGRNGAGKTTLMRALMGLLTVRAETIDYRGRSIRGAQPYEVARLGVGLVPEDRRMFGRLSVADNLELGRKPSADGKSSWDLQRIFEIFPMLRRLLGRKAANLSGGQQQMVAVARTLMGNPDLLLLDEPGEGLAPVIVQELAVQLGKLRSQGLSMIVSEQNLSFARSLADRAYVLETGYIRHQATLVELEARPQDWVKYVAF